MSTIRVEDILRKKQVPQRYQPNSYRIFSDEVCGANELPPSSNAKFAGTAPSIYTQPMIVPAQAIEDRNRPHGDRAAGFLRENARTLNEPVNKVNSRNVNTAAEKRWWEWNLPVENPNSLKKRSQSTSNLKPQQQQQQPMLPARPNKGSGVENIPGFQTTYQQDHGYIKSFSEQQPQGARIGSINENQGAAMRHTYNPANNHAVGIVPVNDLNTFSKANEEQRVFADKMSFEHNYDARKEGNYPVRGKRQGAYVIEQLEPKAKPGTRNYMDQNKGASVWDAMHIDGDAANKKTLPPLHPVVGKPLQPPVPAGPSAPVTMSQRRDPISYYEDPKYGAPQASSQHQQQQHQQQQHQPPQPQPQIPPPPHHGIDAPASMQVEASGKSSMPNDISYQTKALAYNPSWSNINADFQQQRMQAQKNQMMNETSSNFPLGAGAGGMGPGGANELLDNALMYQRPPMINGH